MKLTFITIFIPWFNTVCHMKRIVIIYALCFVVLSLEAQLPPVNAKAIPAFSIQQADGSLFTASSLKTGQPVMLVYFDPDCEHCMVFASELVAKADIISDIQVIMVTYVPVESLNKFIAMSGLRDYPQIKVGTEGEKFIVRYHYNVMQFPFLALHDRNGMLFATYESKIPTVETLVAKFSEQ